MAVRTQDPFFESPSIPTKRRAKNGPERRTVQKKERKKGVTTTTMRKGKIDSNHSDGGKIMLY
jgi:hypothetical protein